MTRSTVLNVRRVGGKGRGGGGGEALGGGGGEAGGISIIFLCFPEDVEKAAVRLKLKVER